MAAVAAQLVAIIARWFTPLAAASAWVSVDRFAVGEHLGDNPTQTIYESRRHATYRTGILTTWPELRRFAWGVFWGNGLGPDLCTRPGGRERVLRDAPAPVTEPLGEGVWLQLSAAPPAPRDGIERLAIYLAPLLDWTLHDLRAADRELGVTAITLPEETAARGGVIPGERATTPGATRRKGVPIKWLPGEEDTGVGLNVYLAGAPSASQMARLEAVIAQWYHDGFAGGFGGAGFHSIDGPSMDGAVLRWYVDLGSADGRRAIRDLARRLASVPDVAATQLVVGTEPVG